MELDSGHKLSELAVDGGMSNSDICMQVRIIIPHSNTRLRETRRETVPSRYYWHPCRPAVHA